MVDVRWDPRQYVVYGDERSRAFFELLARVRVDAPASVVDLGCGPGPLTATLAQRWPNAHVLGVDSSADMVESAAAYAVHGRLEFVRGDVGAWTPQGPVDVVVANALLQWVPDHLALLSRFTSWLQPGGALAFQVPDNFGEPSHTLLEEQRRSPRWRERLAGVAAAGGVERPHAYLHELVRLGLEADVWQTTYLHVLSGADPVLEWVKGTTLRPVLSALDDDERQAFLAEYADALRVAYPPSEAGTVFAFRRTFAVAARPVSRSEPDSPARLSTRS